VLAAAAASVAETNEPWLVPYTGPSRSDIDATTLDGKVLCGYQGWFNTPCDSEPFGFGHWGHGLGETNGRFVVDMWPDLSEYDPKDLCEVPGLKMPDGSPARLYSAYLTGPVLLHCNGCGSMESMASLSVGLSAKPPSRPACATSTPFWPASGRGVIERAASGAMMLDLSMGRNATTSIVMEDWKFLCDKVKVREDSRYLHHQGKPVVLLWGLGFKDRPWAPEQGGRIDQFLQA